MLTAVTAQLASCGDSGTGKATSATVAAPTQIAGSCNNVEGGYCSEYTGSGLKDVQVLRLTCEAVKATFLPSGCPIDGRVGVCVENKGKATETLAYYYTHFPGPRLKLTKAEVAAEGERQCTQGKGHWVLLK